jgi:hypothetical protein
LRISSYLQVSQAIEFLSQILIDFHSFEFLFEPVPGLLDNIFERGAVPPVIHLTNGKDIAAFEGITVQPVKLVRRYRRWRVMKKTGGFLRIRQVEYHLIDTFDGADFEGQGGHIKTGGV